MLTKMEKHYIILYMLYMIKHLKIQEKELT